MAQYAVIRRRDMPGDRKHFWHGLHPCYGLDAGRLLQREHRDADLGDKKFISDHGNLIFYIPKQDFLYFKTLKSFFV
jgi:hypothetical protein